MCQTINVMFNIVMNQIIWGWKSHSMGKHREVTEQDPNYVTAAEKMPCDNTLREIIDVLYRSLYYTGYKNGEKSERLPPFYSSGKYLMKMDENILAVKSRTEASLQAE